MRRLSAWQEVLVGVAVSVCVTGVGQAAAAQAAGAKEEFSKEVAAVLEKRIGMLQELTEDPVILQAVKESNEKNGAVPLTDILTVDRKWIAKDKSVDAFIKSLMTNACANRLMVFQDAHDGYPEVFIADAKGANVCMTNRTSDYYQADEDWWVQGYNNGQGKTFYGKIEYDESAMAESIPVFLPVMDPATQQAIGVLKAIVDITAIKREL